MIVAFGGGSVGNLAGLAASLLFRGIRYVEVPTSFQHLTDGCLSNKQAINGRLGKNHFGVFYAPIFVWADARYLGSEPERSLKAGIAEAIKNGLISQPGFINYLQGRLRPDCRYTAAELGDLALNTVRSKLETYSKGSQRETLCARARVRAYLRPRYRVSRARSVASRRMRSRGNEDGSSPGERAGANIETSRESALRTDRLVPGLDSEAAAQRRRPVHVRDDETR